jgi:molybdopterin/thiamine biosynthesis adenylyltransferase
LDFEFVSDFEIRISDSSPEGAIVAHLVQVGAGSGGMPVLDMVGRDERITRVTLIEPDVYKQHNVVRHLFPLSVVGQLKAELAREWLRERRPELTVELLVCDLLDPAFAAKIDDAVHAADIGVCAADNEHAKYRFDALMRRFGKPWTLGEVLAGGIGGFVHRFVPHGPCYGCVASHLQRSVSVDKPRAPDYSQPGGAVPELTVPAGKAAIGVIAALHAQVTLGWLGNATPQAAEFTSLLLTLERVPEVFEEAYRPYRFHVARSADCLICRGGAAPAPSSAAELDLALDQALARLDHA